MQFVFGHVATFLSFRRKAPRSIYQASGLEFFTKKASHVNRTATSRLQKTHKDHLKLFSESHTKCLRQDGQTGMAGRRLQATLAGRAQARDKRGYGASYSHQRQPRPCNKRMTCCATRPCGCSGSHAAQPSHTSGILPLWTYTLGEVLAFCLSCASVNVLWLRRLSQPYGL